LIPVLLVVGAAGGVHTQVGDGGGRSPNTGGGHQCHQDEQGAQQVPPEQPHHARCWRIWLRAVGAPWEKILDKRSPEILFGRKPGLFWNQNSKISIRGKFSRFAVAQPDLAMDLANGAQFQVQIKDILVRIPKIYMYDTRMEVFHTEIRNQNSMRLVIT
jgi:hypothetical protein